MARIYRLKDEPVPGFRLVKFLGKGGFGEVWKASAPGGTEAAIKIINLSSNQGIKEFRAIRIVKLIRHPNIVPIIAFWLKDLEGNFFVDDAEVSSMTLRTEGSALIIAMGLGDKNLLDRLKECRTHGQTGIPPDELLDYLESSARAIDHLNQATHLLGDGPVAIQHCDIKPQNILIVGGSAQVCDFGLARVLGDARTSASSGSAAYMAPEFICANQPSPWTDQYSLAISYVELRTGALPFEAKSVAAALTIHAQGKLDLSKLPEAERAVIKKATALNPQARYPRTVDLVRALRQAIGKDEALGQIAESIRPELLIQPGSEIVPGYRLVKRLGRGGYGEVWQAAAPGGKPVALKIIKSLAAGQGRQEFKALELIKGVDHHHLMDLHAYWLLDKQGRVIPDEQLDRPDSPKAQMLVIASKLASKNLVQRLQECQEAGHAGIPLTELLVYMRQSAEAIDYLNSPRHILGDRTVSIQHRDIKPENILIAADTVKVGDFGLAKVLEGTSAVIHGDSMGLTLAYAAPEMFSGSVTRWSDQYSLAITYFRLRTGRFPFDSAQTTYRVIEVHQEGRLDLSQLPAAEREVIARATALLPHERYDTCVAMVRALETACGFFEPAPELTPKPKSGAKRAGKNGPAKPPGPRPGVIRPESPGRTDGLVDTQIPPAPTKKPTSLPSPAPVAKPVQTWRGTPAVGSSRKGLYALLLVGGVAAFLAAVAIVVCVLRVS